MAFRKEPERCRPCEREVSFVTWHHLVPKEEGGKYTETVPLCQPCHSSVHLHLTNRELALRFHNVEALQKAEPFRKYLEWVKTKNIDRLKNRRSRRRR